MYLEQDPENDRRFLESRPRDTERRKEKTKERKSERCKHDWHLLDKRRTENMENRRKNQSRLRADWISLYSSLACLMFGSFLFCSGVMNSCGRRTRLRPSSATVTGIRRTSQAKRVLSCSKSSQLCPSPICIIHKYLYAQFFFNLAEIKFLIQGRFKVVRNSQKCLYLN